MAGRTGRRKGAAPQPCWCSQMAGASWTHPGRCEAKAELSALSPLTLAPAAQSVAPGTPPRAHTSAWSAQHLQGQSSRGELPEAAKSMGRCLTLPGTPSQEYVPVRTGRNHAVPPSTAQDNAASFAQQQQGFKQHQSLGKGDASVAGVHPLLTPAQPPWGSSGLGIRS